MKQNYLRLSQFKKKSLQNFTFYEFPKDSTAFNITEESEGISNHL